MKLKLNSISSVMRPLVALLPYHRGFMAKPKLWLTLKSVLLTPFCEPEMRASDQEEASCVFSVLGFTIASGIAAVAVCPFVYVGHNSRKGLFICSEVHMSIGLTSWEFFPQVCFLSYAHNFKRKYNYLHDGSYANVFPKKKRTWC